jgi:signal transduction histidine kinase
MENRIATVLSIVIASGAAALISRRMSKPLAELTEAASDVAKGGAAPRVPDDGPEDVRRAASAFNAMTDQVQRTLASQRQLLSAVGHDLRTPITAMRISMEFLEEGETRQSLEKNLNELQQLTEAVLSAAKGAGGEPKRNVDIAALLDSLCADMEELGDAVTWEQRGPAPFFCRPNEITRAARNLIENAVAYGKCARVRLEESRDAFEIVVDDDGPGIPDVDRERVFEPFVRLETSRNLETGGTGLGLTLVKAIAEGHGGSVVLENRPQGGLTVRLRLPRNVTKA